MAFEGLTEKLSAAFKKLRGKGRLSEADVKEAMKEIRMALLEADVNFKVVKQFVATVTERAIGSDVLESLTPAQMIVKIVNEELTALMGGENTKLTISPKPPTVVMLVGLNGAGKTTNGAKLAGFMKKQGKRPLLVACDTFRPAAITQLEVVGQQVDVPVFQMGQIDPVDIARAGIEHAKKHGNDIVFIDTAGRLHVDEELMEQLKVMKAAIDPTEILLIVDAMIGQDAVNAAKTFDEALDITGVMLTKLDGDARGGAALSIKAVTGKPIKFVGVGEKLDQVELFYPDRMASRILGMGDVLSLIEKAQQTFDAKKAAELEQKLRKNKFTLADFLRSAGSDQGHGFPVRHRRDAPRHERQGTGRGQRGRERPGPHRGHYPVHDPGGAGEPLPAEQQPEKAHRRRLRHSGRGHQPPAQAVRYDAADDQAVLRQADEAHGQTWKNGKARQAAGTPLLTGW